MQSFVSGDEAVLREAMSEHGPSILSFIYRCIPEPSTAEDLYQETWIRAFNSRHRYDPDRPLRNWLYSIALNAVRAHIRRRQRQTEAETRSARPEVPSAEREVSSTELRALLDRLPGEQREVFLLREFQGLSYEQIAEITQRPIGTLKSQMFHAVQKLKKIVEPLWTAPK
jgi:RNA polymerase sigma-70 factor (ECF subfamily)